MLADPLSITVAGVTTSVPKTSSGVNQGSFTSNDGNLKITVSHQYGKRNRRMYRLDHQKVAPDPLISSTNIVHSMGVYLVVDAPVTGYTVAQQKEVLDGFVAHLNASSGLLITKFLGGEN